MRFVTCGSKEGAALQNGQMALLAQQRAPTGLCEHATAGFMSQVGKGTNSSAPKSMIGQALPGVHLGWGRKGSTCVSKGSRSTCECNTCII